MKNENQKSLKSFETNDEVATENVKGGINMGANIDQQMDAYWELYDLGFYDDDRNRP
ncbi:hypothetical protein [Brumimicrobium salinarum]|uniref:hypothetical protein n=1 Tax=Brumimicrobium salinarum TaxID=2058658 RepID=UPI0013FDDDB1|nr:hypothetical protein [Brumimicrobium salinarum]